MAEISAGGMLTGAATSCASTRPTADTSGTVSVSNGFCTAAILA